MNNGQKINLIDMSILWTNTISSGGYNDLVYEQLWKTPIKDQDK
jgi:hypothetical protein